MQPVQPSLMPDLFPAPPEVLIAELPDQHVAAAVALLADLTAKAATARSEAGDE